MIVKRTQIFYDNKDKSRLNNFILDKSTNHNQSY
jgi:hypothetical protein